MRVVSRKEKKFLVDLAGAKKLEGILASVVAPDPHNGLQGYPIRSLYFDTLHDRDYAEKLMGTDPRLVRVRGCARAGLAVGAGKLVVFCNAAVGIVSGRQPTRNRRGADASAFRKGDIDVGIMEIERAFFTAGDASGQRAIQRPRRRSQWIIESKSRNKRCREQSCIVE